MICTDKATVSIGSLDASDLRERTVPPLALLLAIVAAVGAWAYLPLRPFPWQQSLLLAVLASAALAAWVLSRAHPLAAGLTLLASQFGMAFLSESLLPGSASLFTSPWVRTTSSAELCFPACADRAAQVATSFTGALPQCIGASVCLLADPATAVPAQLCPKTCPDEDRQSTALSQWLSQARLLLLCRLFCGEPISDGRR
jgi:hypothetical protein